jgi:hypothetical protein
MFDLWNSGSKRKCTLTYTPLLLDTFSIEYPLVFPIDYSEIRLGLTQAFVRKVQVTFVDGVSNFTYFVIFLKKVELNPKRISE